MVNLHRRATITFHLHRYWYKTDTNHHWEAERPTAVHNYCTWG